MRNCNWIRFLRVNDTYGPQVNVICTKINGEVVYEVMKPIATHQELVVFYLPERPEEILIEKMKQSFYRRTMDSILEGELLWSWKFFFSLSFSFSKSCWMSQCLVCLIVNNISRAHTQYITWLDCSLFNSIKHHPIGYVYPTQETPTTTSLRLFFLSPLHLAPCILNIQSSSSSSHTTRTTSMILLVNATVCDADCKQLTIFNTIYLIGSTLTDSPIDLSMSLVVDVISPILSPTHTEDERKSVSGDSYTSTGNSSSGDLMESTVVIPPSSKPKMPRGERNLLPCEVCGKAFDRPSLLKRHMRTHTGSLHIPSLRSSSLF